MAARRRTGRRSVFDKNPPLQEKLLELAKDSSLNNDEFLVQINAFAKSNNLPELTYRQVSYNRAAVEKEFEVLAKETRLENEVFQRFGEQIDDDSGVNLIKVSGSLLHNMLVARIVKMKATQEYLSEGDESLKSLDRVALLLERVTRSEKSLQAMAEKVMAKRDAELLEAAKNQAIPEGKNAVAFVTELIEKANANRK